MLKRKKDARPMDVNQLARHLVELTTAPLEPTKEEMSKVMASLGRRGGKVGGKRRMETMTPEQRSAVALKAAQARWKQAKHKKKAKKAR
jgi:hypothetical protein